VPQIINVIYLCTVVSFIAGLKLLRHPKTARLGNVIAAGGMLIAVVFTVIISVHMNLVLVLVALLLGGLIGVVFAVSVKMTQMPQLIAIFNGFGGLASLLVAVAECLRLSAVGLSIPQTIAISLSVMIGAIAFSGSMVACLKLHGVLTKNSLTFRGRKLLALVVLGSMFLAMFLLPHYGNFVLYCLIVASLLLGLLLVMPIGGADMPVVIALLNSYSGMAAAITGFVLVQSNIYIAITLIICGSLVGASGFILTRIMCKALNRSLYNIMFSQVVVHQDSAASAVLGHVSTASADEAAVMFEAADKIIIIPGYGLAVSQAQHAVKEFADYLESLDKTVLYAIHPVAGRMPGHMNVLLAEANVAYHKLQDLDNVNPEFSDCDIALVVGANDVVNPAAISQPDSPIYGMPILDAAKAKSVIILKRSLAAGYSGVDNELFGYDNAMLVLGDAKSSLRSLLRELKWLD
jgi:H+-translocating NAD(P) transhydrogenase subunit beta